MRGPVLVALVALLLAVGVWPPSSAAQTPGSVPGVASTATTPQDPNALTTPSSLDDPPPGRRMRGRDVQAIADAVPKIRRERRKWPGSTSTVYLKGPERWQVSYYAKRTLKDLPSKEIGQVVIDDATGDVVEAWTGFHVAWTMARGYPGAFGRKINSPFVWIGLSIAFLVPFLRRPWRMLHVDLLVLLAFSLSYMYFGWARIDVSVPTVYPLLIYLLVRMLMIARARARPGEPGTREPFPLLVPAGVLGIGVVFLLGFRVGLNLTNSNVIDVGYAGVIGGDHLSQGEPLWGNFPDDNPRGDTYGPVNYLAYLPFELIWPYKGVWDDLPAAHGAAVVFDLLCVGMLYVLGRRLRGPQLGVILAYAWTAFPFTLLVANSNANDSLVAVLILGALLATASPLGRGALLGAATLTKFAPMALGPLFATIRGPAGVGVFAAASGAEPEATGNRPGWRSGVAAMVRELSRPVLLTSVGFTVAVVVFLVPVVAWSDLSTFYDRTLAFQDGRDSPFSIWGYYGELGWLQSLVRYAGVLLAVAVAVFPRRRDIVSVAALAAAVLIALQLSVTHWFYLYLVWFFPLVLVALFAPYAEPDPAAGEAGETTAVGAAGDAAPESGADGDSSPAVSPDAATA